MDTQGVEGAYKNKDDEKGIEDQFIEAAVQESLQEVVSTSLVARIEKTGMADTEEEDNSSMERRKKRLKDPPPTSITESDLKPTSKTSTLASDMSKKPAARKPKKQKSPDKKKL